MKKQNKGFTLVELLIVIVIIGILAAIIIPSVSSAIDKANFASDQSDAKNMNTTLLAYCTTNGIDPSELEAPEVRSIVSSQDKNYTFVPKSSNGIFWYNTAKGEIEVTQEDLIAGQSVSKINAAYAAGHVGDSIEELVDGYLYLNTSGPLASILFNLRNITSTNDYSNTIKKNIEDAAFTGNLKTVVEIVYNKFNPTTDTLFINESKFVYGGGTNEIKNVVFGTGIKIVPNMNGDGQSAGLTSLTFAAETKLRIPATVEVVMPGAFSGVTSNTKIETNSDVNFLEGSLSESLKASNGIAETAIDYARVQEANRMVTVTFKATATSDEVIFGYLNGDNSKGYAEYSRVDGTDYYLLGGIFIDGADYVVDKTDKDSSKHGSVVINTKELLGHYPNITTLMVNQKPILLGSGAVGVCITVQAFDAQGLLVNLEITYAVKY